MSPERSQLIQKLNNATRGFVQRYGIEAAKRRLWNNEYSNGRWDHLDTRDDCHVERLLERFASRGRILDLGCGSGVLAANLEPASYTEYVGVDISDVAIKRARERAQERQGRGECVFVQHDILDYKPSGRFNVILYGDSIYYISARQILPMLKRYSSFLAEDGVFIARIFDVSGKRRDIVETIQGHFTTVESHPQGQSCTVIFRSTAARN